MIIIISLVFLSSITTSKTYNKIFQVIEYVTPEILHSTLRVVVNNKINSKRIKNDYNDLFLPNTQFAKVDFKKIKLDFIKPSTVGYLNAFKRKSFYIDFYNKYLFVMPKNGTIYYKEVENLEKNNKKFKKLNSNLKTKNILDFYIDEKYIYVSYVKRENDCKYLYLAKSKINFTELLFKDIFSINKECAGNIQAGRIQKIINNGSSHILLSTSADSLKGEGQKDFKPQSVDSLYSKIISINSENYSYKIYS